MSQSQIFFLFTREPTEEQLEQCGPPRKAELAEKWMLTVKPEGDADLVGPPSDRLTRLEARAITNTPEWNGNGPGGS